MNRIGSSVALLNGHSGFPIQLGCPPNFVTQPTIGFLTSKNSMFFLFSIVPIYSQFLNSRRQRRIPILPHWFVADALDQLRHFFGRAVVCDVELAGSVRSVAVGRRGPFA